MKSTRRLVTNIDYDHILTIEWEAFDTDKSRPATEITLRNWHGNLGLAIRTQSGFVNVQLDQESVNHLAAMLDHYRTAAPAPLTPTNREAP